MKKRISCIVLAVLMLLSTLSGCKSTKSIDDDSPITKGEFFAYIVYMKDMVSDKYTKEQLISCKDGSVEADILVEYGYISEKMAASNLDKEVDRETVATVVANFTYGLKQGNTKDIKDSDMLENPQLIADAYATGLFELENGYFNGAKKMSFNEVLAIIDKSAEYVTNLHFSPEDTKFDVTDNIVKISEENDYEIQFDDELYAPESKETNFTAFSFLSSNSQQKDDYEITGGRSGFRAVINSLDFISNRMEKGKGYKLPVVKGDSRRGFLPNTFVYGILESYRVLSNGEYDCSFSVPEFTECAEDVNFNHQTATLERAVLSPDFSKETTVCGWKVNVSLENGVFTASAKKDKFYVEQADTYSQAWRNEIKGIDASVTFKISDFKVDVVNPKSFVNRKGYGHIQVTFDSETKVKFSQSLRYTPDDNRNGHFPSNFTRSRFTDSDAKGAKTIKIARIPYGIGCVTGEVYIYLLITVDGRIEFTTSVNDGGFRVECNNGHCSLGKVKSTATNDDLIMELNIKIRGGADVKVNICTLIPLFDYDLGLDLNFNSIVSMYYEENNNVEEVNNVYIPTKTLDSVRASDSSFGYCVELGCRISFNGSLQKCPIKTILDFFGQSKLLDIKDKTLWEGHAHYDNGEKVKECQRGKTKSDENIDASDDGSVKLSAYKIILAPYTCDRVLIEEIPFETKKRINSSNSITVSSSNEEVVSVTYNKKGGFVIISADGEGSAEITVTAKTGMWWWKEYVTQKISVTVSKNAEGGTVVAYCSDLSEPKIVLVN